MRFPLPETNPNSKITKSIPSQIQVSKSHTHTHTHKNSSSHGLAYSHLVRWDHRNHRWMIHQAREMGWLSMIGEGEEKKRRRANGEGLSHRRLFLDFERSLASPRQIRESDTFVPSPYRKVHDLVNRLLELPRLASPRLPPPLCLETRGELDHEAVNVPLAAAATGEKRKVEPWPKRVCRARWPAVRHDFQFPGHP